METEYKILQGFSYEIERELNELNKDRNVKIEGCFISGSITNVIILLYPKP